MTVSVRPMWDALLKPRTVAVLGVSPTHETLGNHFLRGLLAFGYPGSIYPIHPTAREFEGLKTYGSVRDTPSAVDYAYVALPSTAVREALNTKPNHVHFAQVVASGFGETADGQALEEELLRQARRTGTRILGPNCLGTYSPRGHLTFLNNVSSDTGCIGIMSQSGGLTIDIIRQGAALGLSFSAVVSLGNSIDVEPSDLLQCYLSDDATRVIGIYLEDVKDGQRFYRTLRDARGSNPIVLLLGGQTRWGQKAAQSHTGALATSSRVWHGLARQTGTLLVETFDEFLAALVGFQYWKPHMAKVTRRVALVGNGGGTSVLMADYLARRGLIVAPFGSETMVSLTAMQLPPGSSIANPVDLPAGTFRLNEGRIVGQVLKTILTKERLDAILLHVNAAAIGEFTQQSDQIIEQAMQSASNAVQLNDAHFGVVYRTSEGDRSSQDRSVENYPVFREMSQAGNALFSIAQYERFLEWVLEFRR